MEIEQLRVLLMSLCGLSVVPILIFMLRKKDPGIDYDKIINQLNDQQDKDLKTLELGNKKIDELESKILICKKKLNMKLFK